jgi:hypothetical protein
VLLNEPAAVTAAAAADPGYVRHRLSMRSAFTPLDDVTLLHVASEYGHTAAASALIGAGADVDARAGLDADGLGAHTPIFHTVNSHANRSEAVPGRCWRPAPIRCPSRRPGLGTDVRVGVDLLRSHAARLRAARHAAADAP